jgi:tetratricopeptide (TPR) repeat protein
MQNENVKPVTLNERVNEFVQRNRKPIFVVAGLIVLSVFGVIGTLSIMDALRGRAINTVEGVDGFADRYEKLLPSITEDYSAIDVEELLADLESFAKKNSGYAGGRVWSIIGSIYGDKGDWAGAETAWAAAAKKAKGTYLVPLAYFNAGAAAEEQGKTETAIEYYTSSLATDFPGAARAQFAIGRLQEALNDTEAAIEAYRTIISQWPHEGVWISLAHSRIIDLEMP